MFDMIINVIYLKRVFMCLTQYQYLSHVDVSLVGCQRVCLQPEFNARHIYELLRFFGIWTLASYYNWLYKLLFMYKIIHICCCFHGPFLFLMVILCWRIAGFVIPGLLLISTGYVDCNAPLAVFLITAAVAFAGISFSGWAVNHLDLAPPYAGQHNEVVSLSVQQKKTLQQRLNH